MFIFLYFIQKKAAHYHEQPFLLSPLYERPIYPTKPQ